MSRTGRLTAKKMAEQYGGRWYECSICHGIFSGYGNNPYPEKKGKNDRCCGVCNFEKVIPARIAQLGEGGN